MGTQNGSIPVGANEVKLNLGVCKGFNDTYDSYTGLESLSVIEVEEIPPCEYIACVCVCVVCVCVCVVCVCECRCGCACMHVYVHVHVHACGSVCGCGYGEPLLSVYC